MDERLVDLVHTIEVLDQPQETSAVEGLECRFDGLPACRRAFLVGHNHKTLRRRLGAQITKCELASGKVWPLSAWPQKRLIVACTRNDAMGQMQTHAPQQNGLFESLIGTSERGPT